MTKSISALVAVLFLFPVMAFASESMSNVKVNGVSQVTVAPSTQVTVTVDVSLTNGDDYDAVSYRIGSGNLFCVDVSDSTDSDQPDWQWWNPETQTLSTITLNVNAPGTVAVHDIDLRLYDADNCDDGDGVISPSDNDDVTRTSLNDGVVVEIPLTPQEQCELDGGTWNDPDCYTLAEQEADCEADSVGVWQVPDCYTAAEQGYDCIVGGGYWTGAQCDPIPTCSEGYLYNGLTNQCDPTPQTSCNISGETWTGSDCIHSSGGGLGISIGIYCDDPLVAWMPVDGKCWPVETRPQPRPDFGNTHVPIFFTWWDDVLNMMFTKVL